MELVGNYIIAFIDSGGLFAPLLFISFHLLRPLFFFPVIIICISGGILFGTFAGTLYSVIGITLSSIIFYGIIRWMPKTFANLIRLKQKVIGKHAEITTPQITLLRLIPFIHFHLLCLCLIEISEGFKDYTKASLLSSIPFAIIYTSIGQWIAGLSFIYSSLILLALVPLLYIIRKKENNIKWRDFFQTST